MSLTLRWFDSYRTANHRPLKPCYTDTQASSIFTAVVRVRSIEPGCSANLAHCCRA